MESLSLLTAVQTVDLQTGVLRLGEGTPCPKREFVIDVISVISNALRFPQRQAAVQHLGIKPPDYKDNSNFCRKETSWAMFN